MSDTNYFKQRLEDTKIALASARDGLNGVLSSFNDDQDRQDAVNVYKKAIQRKEEYEQRIEKLRHKKRQEESDLKQQEENKKREENQNNKSPEKKESFGKRVKNRVKKAGRAVGKGIYRVGKGVSATGKGIKTAGRALVMTAKVLRAAAKAIKATAKAVRMAAKTVMNAGIAMIKGGAALSATGVGAVVGVPMIAAGATMAAAGAATFAGSFALDAAGLAINSAAKVAELSGKVMQKAGNVIDRAGKQMQKTGNTIYKQFNNGKGINGADNSIGNSKTLSLSSQKEESQDNSMSPVVETLALVNEHQTGGRENKEDSPETTMINNGRTNDLGQEQSQYQDNVNDAPVIDSSPPVADSISIDEKTENLETVHTLASKTGRTSLASKSSGQIRSHITKTQGKQSFKTYRNTNKDKYPEWRPRIKHAPTTISPAIMQRGRSSDGNS